MVEVNMKTPAVMVGLAIGDTLGMPFEKMKSSDPMLLAWDGTMQDCDEGHPFNRGLKKGQWTDDTQMSIVLAESLLANGCYNQMDTARRYLEWYQGEPRGTGGSIRQSLEAFRDTGKLSPVEGSWGTGVLMRIAPMGAFFPSRYDMMTYIREDGMITHDSNESHHAATSHAYYVRSLLDGHERITDSLTYYADRMQQVSEAWVTAKYALAKSQSFEEAVTSAVRFGGDTDTVASITGALAGAFYGLEGIPEKYLVDLERVDYLKELDARMNANRMGWATRVR